ncbi:MAG: peptidase M36 [Lysobacteraceae bacterium]|nr:MAG: peptidase M36 [Xanthomonadaceae bacterium]
MLNPLTKLAVACAALVACHGNVLAGTALETHTQLALDYIEDNAADLGLVQADLNEMRVRDAYQTRHNGVSHLVFRQYVNGIAVHGGDIQVNVDRNGEILNLHNGFVPMLADSAKSAVPVVEARSAVEIAARDMGIPIQGTAKILSQEPGQPRSIRLEWEQVSNEPMDVKLVYAKTENGLRLAWDLVIKRADAWKNFRVDAVDGKVVAVDDWIAHDNTYRVIPFPYADPNEPGATHSVVSDPASDASAAASPFGWHATGSTNFTDTRGNNVSAQEDVDANNAGGFRPDGGATLDFDFAWDPALQPDEGTNMEAAIVNLFYWNNIIHDIMYAYGFDEPAGNFQIDNNGNGGLGNDPVQADAQDGSGTNNANFGTPPDGAPPRMQMFLFTPGAELEVHSPAAVAGTYTAGAASFGEELDVTGVDGIVEEANDGTDTTSDACEALVGFTPGRIALIDRGSCEFGVKVLNAEQAGASAAIVVNNAGDGVINMGPGAVGNLVTITSIMVGQSDGDAIRAELANTVDVTMQRIDRVDFDGDFDNGVVIHEYGHGISNRLTGGPSNTFCLGNAEQMGEGWSDLFALILNAVPDDTSTTPKTIGSFATDNPAGFRQYPYTTDMMVNPHTLADIDSVSVPHGVGSVWTAMVWEMYWNLVEMRGYDPDMYTGRGGNNLTLQLVMDGLKLQPCSPGFESGRDAILLADQVNNNGANQCAIWAGFAKRGLGFGASSGDVGILGDETVSTALPPECLVDEFFIGNFE